MACSLANLYWRSFFKNSLSQAKFLCAIFCLFLNQFLNPHTAVHARIMKSHHSLNGSAKTEQALQSHLYCLGLLSMKLYRVIYTALDCCPWSSTESFILPWIAVHEALQSHLYCLGLLSMKLYRVIYTALDCCPWSSTESFILPWIAVHEALQSHLYCLGLLSMKLYRFIYTSLDCCPWRWYADCKSKEQEVNGTRQH